MHFWKKKDNLVLSGLVALFFAAVIFWQEGGCVHAARPAKGDALLLKIPFIGADKKQHTLAEFKGKPLIINFWATWCPVCVKKMATLNRFAKKFAEKGGKVITISEDVGIDMAQAYMTRNQYDNLTAFVDEGGGLMAAVGARGLPTTVFIDENGTVKGSLSAGLDWGSQEVHEMVNSYLGVLVSSN